MDITGARWATQTADAILKLRALITNGDFDTYWDSTSPANTNATTQRATPSPPDPAHSKRNAPM